jgi:hypothetical protein
MANASDFLRPAPPGRHRRVLVRRSINAPLALVERRMRQPESCGLFLRTTAGARFARESLAVELRVGPLHQSYAASWTASPGAASWSSSGTSASWGLIRASSQGAESTLVEVELSWWPHTAFGAFVAGTDLDRRRIASELGRLAAVLESEAGEDRLGPLAVEPTSGS